MFCDPMFMRQNIIIFFKLVYMYMNKFNLENCTNVKLNRDMGDFQKNEDFSFSENNLNIK